MSDDRFRFADETASLEVALFAAKWRLAPILSVAGVALERVGDPFTELA